MTEEVFDMDSRTTTLAGDKEMGVERSARSSYHGSLKESKEDIHDSPEDTEKEEGSFKDVPVVDRQTAEEEGEYPTGIRMTFIVVALILSIFLVISPPSRLQEVKLTKSGCPRHDNRSYGHT
jgi:hypothetical protein